MLDTQHTVPGNGSHWALMSDFAPIKRQHVHDQDTNKRSWGLGKHQQGMTSMCSDNLPCVTKGVPGPAKRTKKAKQHRKNKSCKRAKSASWASWPSFLATPVADGFHQRIHAFSSP